MLLNEEVGIIFIEMENMMTIHGAEHPTNDKQKALDPVCGMEVDPSAPAATLLHEGTTYLFCSTHCLEKFKSSPDSFTGAVETKPGHSITATIESTLKVNTFTCPMHPEIIKDVPGSCPICGMDLVLRVPADTEENKAYKELSKKLKVAVFFTLPVFILSMSEMMPGNPFISLLSRQSWNWIQLALSIPVVF